MRAAIADGRRDACGKLQAHDVSVDAALPPRYAFYVLALPRFLRIESPRISIR